MSKFRLAMRVVAGAVMLALGHAVRADYFSPGSATLIASGTTGNSYTHVEGVIYDNNGGVLYGELNSGHDLTANKDLIWRYDLTTHSNTIVVADSGGTQGTFYKSNGQMVTADRDSRTVSLRNGSTLAVVSTLASSFGGLQFNGPNDLLVDGQGGIYFTDPNFENFSNRQPVDAVYYITPGGTVNQVISAGTSRPNGIILSPDGSTLYVGLWGSNQINAYTVSSFGVLTNAHTFVSGSTTVPTPDGMTVDPWGNVIVACSNSVKCFSPAGTQLFSISVTGADNVALGGADGKTLFVTGSTNLYSVPLTQVPEPGTVAVLGVGAVLLASRRRKVAQ